MGLPTSTRYYKPNPRHPRAVGYCMRSGEPFFRKDLIMQLEYQGSNLVPTGWWIGRPYLDKPNPQRLVPPVKPDPVPVSIPVADQTPPQLPYGAPWVPPYEE